MADHNAPKTAKDDLGPALLVVSWVFAGISLVVILMRAYVRLRIVKRFYFADWLILFTYVLAVCDSIFCTIAVHSGLGQHIHLLRPNQISDSIKFVYLSSGFTIMAPCLGRISYALLLLELVDPSKRRKIFLWSIIWTQFAVDLCTVVVIYTNCRPIHERWGRHQKEKCRNPKVQEYVGYFQGSVCSSVDLVLALFPASLFWKLNMKRSTKISLSVLMGLGVFAMICSIIRTTEVRTIGQKGDPTYAFAKFAIWFTLEAYVVLLAVSIPTLRPLVRKSGTKYGYSKDQLPSFVVRSSQRNRNPGNDCQEDGDDQVFILDDRDLLSSKEQSPKNNVNPSRQSVNEIAQDTSEEGKRIWK